MELTVILMWSLIATSSAVTVELSVPAGIPLTGEVDQVCLSRPLPTTAPYFVVNFTMVGEHVDGMVLIFGCASDPLSPDRSDHYWHMTGNFMNNDGCPNNTMFWPLPGSRQLPVGTGFLVSGSTPYHRLAVCTHYHDHLGMRYGNVTKQRIGAVMDVVAASQSHGINAAGAFDLVKESGSIPAHSVTTLTAKHTFRKDNIKINAFASSVHTHQLGMRVRAWLTKADGRVEELDDIASNGTVAGGVRHTVIETGDTVSVSCTYNNTNSKDVIVGVEADDEMCVYMVGYYVDDNHSVLKDNGFLG